MEYKIMEAESVEWLEGMFRIEFMEDNIRKTNTYKFVSIIFF